MLGCHYCVCVLDLTMQHHLSGLELRGPPASASEVLELKLRATTHPAKTLLFILEVKGVLS